MQYNHRSLQKPWHMAMLEKRVFWFLNSKGMDYRSGKLPRFRGVRNVRWLLWTELCSLQNSYVEAFVPLGWAIIQSGLCLQRNLDIQKKDVRDVHSQKIGHVKTIEKENICKSRREASTETKQR